MVPPVEVYSILGLDCSLKIDSYVGIFEILLDIFNITLVNHFVFAGHAVVVKVLLDFKPDHILSDQLRCGLVKYSAFVIKGFVEFKYCNAFVRFVG